MTKYFKNKLAKNFKILGLVFLVLLTAIQVSYFNYKKNLNSETYNNIIDNIYLKKTLNHIVVKSWA